MNLVWVSLSYATFGVVVDDCGIVVDAAPIAHWTIGQHEKCVADFYRRKGARFLVLVEPVTR